jgi:D-glycero-beta-D-manno-heptose-7-phosphate kinase
METALHTLIEGFSQVKIAVVGDIMLDRYIFGSVDRVSPEAPIPIVMERTTQLVPGGAGNTAANITALGATCYLFGVIGEDQAAHDVIETLQSHQIDTSGISEVADRPTTQKTRVLGNHQQIVRLDTESSQPLAEGTSTKLLDNLKEVINECQALVVCDYAKGVITPTLIEELKIVAKEHKLPLLIDPRPEHKALYHDVTYLTPNKKETAGMVHMPVRTQHEAEVLGLQLAKELNSNILLTMSEDGMLVIERDTETATHIPTKAEEVTDVSGAGDTVIAAMALSLAAGASAHDAALIATHAASIVVAKLGTATVSQTELAATF